jgi:hypothetical protein
MILLYEYYNQNLEFHNEVKELLAQYPYLRYSIQDKDETLCLTFSGDVTFKYIKGILAPYTLEEVQAKPLKVNVTGKRQIADYEEFKGKAVIGTVENIEITTFGLEGVSAKIDTGATTSSMHVSNLEIDKKRNMVSFTPLDKSHKGFVNKRFRVPIVAQVRVQSSNGTSQMRALIKVDIIIKGKRLETYFSLSDRKDMQYPVLIGKDVLSSNFIIDTGISNAD